MNHDEILPLDKIRKIESKAIKYIIWELGFNVQIKEINKTEIGWEVDLFISVPNTVKTADGKERTFYYIFDISKPLVFKENLTIDYSLSVKSSDIDADILTNFWKINKEIEKVILQYGANKWGKISFIKTYLNKASKIIALLKENGKIDIKELITAEPNLFEMASVISDLDFIELDKKNHRYYVASPKLTKFFELEVQDPEKFSVIEVVLGELVAKKLDVLVKDFNLTIIKRYVDIVTLYYINAAYFGSLISLTYNDFLHKIIAFRRKIGSTRERISFGAVMEELCKVGFFSRVEGEIVGNQDIFEKIMKKTGGKLPEGVKEAWTYETFA